MKTNLPVTDLALPVSTGNVARPYSVSRPVRTASGYDAAGVLDTVEIGGGKFQPVPADTPIKQVPAQKSGKGIYIDLWA
jgi:hypothetical protein